MAVVLGKDGRAGMVTKQDLGAVKVFHVQGRQLEGPKEAAMLVRSDLIQSMVIYIDEGGENALHAHTAADQIYVTVEGEVAFYGEGDTLLAKVGPGGGILIPRGTKYWFERSSSQQAVLLRIWSQAPGVRDQTIDYAEPPPAVKQLRKQLRSN